MEVTLWDDTFTLFLVFCSGGPRDNAGVFENIVETNIAMQGATDCDKKFVNWGEKIINASQKLWIYSPWIMSMKILMNSWMQENSVTGDPKGWRRYWRWTRGSHIELLLDSKKAGWRRSAVSSRPPIWTVQASLRIGSPLIPCFFNFSKTCSSVTFLPWWVQQSLTMKSSPCSSWTCKQCCASTNQLAKKNDVDDNINFGTNTDGYRGWQWWLGNDARVGECRVVPEIFGWHRSEETKDQGK